MKCRQGAIVTRVHGLQHVESLCPTAFSYDDSVGSHAQRVGDKLSNGDRPAALGIGKTRFESDDVRMLIESEFGAVLDCDDALFVGDKAR